MSLSIKRLTLHNFRNYDERRLDVGDANVALIGENGAGKTNILEALSLFAPGRGLRGAGLSDMQKFGADSNWAAAIQLQDQSGLHDLATGLDASGAREKRIYKINGSIARSQEIFTEHLSLLWLTPQMDKLWLEDKSQRRRFLDKLIAQFDPAHLGRITRYEQTMRERMKLLSQGRYDPLWVGALEKIMVESGTAIAAHRIDLIERLNAQSEQNAVPSFPRFRVGIDGMIENNLTTKSALAAEDEFTAALIANRSDDAASCQTAVGTHRSDFLIFDAARGYPATLCSTGEQKALLISLILAHAALIANERGMPPILLFDELTAHLDPGRRRLLLDYLKATRMQFWLTGTEPDPVIAQHCAVIPLSR